MVESIVPQQPVAPQAAVGTELLDLVGTTNTLLNTSLIQSTAAFGNLHANEVPNDDKRFQRRLQVLARYADVEVV